MKRSTILGLGFDHLIANRLEAGLQPGKLVQALLQKVQCLGVQVLTGIDVKSYQTHSHGIELETVLLSQKGNSFKFISQQLLLCTNAFTQQLFPAIDIRPTADRYLLQTQLTILE